jgi:urease accessory protein
VEHLLRLLQLADSALPVGAAAHSFGLESLIQEGLLGAGELESFLLAYLEESGRLDAAFCRSAHALTELRGEEFAMNWRILNQRLSARKLSRESRDASLTLGRRFLGLASQFLPATILGATILGATIPGATATDSHHVAAFGLVAGVAGIDERSAALAWLHQSTTTLISAAQRLAPLGQTRASCILWSLKPLMAEIAQSASVENCFTPVPEIAAMRHAKLSTRLFIS